MPNEDSREIPSIAAKDRWLAYALNAWDAAGRPRGLDPSLIEVDPVRYNAAYYDYFERRFLDLWMRVFDRVKPNDGTLIRVEDSAFREAWQRNFRWETTWKQLLPLFVYGSVCGVNNAILADLASHYCIGQAIPSTVIDRILDEPASSNVASDAVFVVLCYTKGLAGLRRLGLSSELETCFVDLTRAMYSIMLSEHEQRRKPLPSRVMDAIHSYSGPKSRLVSSIFFGVLPRWASLVGRPLPAGMDVAIDKLRQVRQLNDEIADAEEDITHGLVTLPWLLGIDEASDLRTLIEELRQNPQSREAADACVKRLHQTDALPRACSMTLQLLSESMEAVMDNLRFATNFDVTLLHNVRWAHVTRIIRNGYVDDGAMRQPLLPHSVLTEAVNPVAPVAGAGTVVTNLTGKVLMSLVSKRGMVRWELPAGVAKLDESMEAAARRETLEETGIDVTVAEPLALCWHYSRELGKGWMGVFFGASPAGTVAGESFMVIQPSAIGQTRADPGRRPDLYEPAMPKTFDFGRFDQQGTASSPLTSHENILAAGFVEWTRIPAGRIHPLHRKLLEARASGQSIDLLVRDADTDVQAYEPNAPFYIV